MAAHLTTESSSRPAAVGEALDGAPSDEPVSTVTLHVTAGPQGALVRRSTRGATCHLPIGQTRGVTPVRVFVVELGSVVFLHKVIRAIFSGPRSSCNNTKTFGTSNSDLLYHH